MPTVDLLVNNACIEIKVEVPYFLAIGFYVAKSSHEASPHRLRV